MFPRSINERGRTGKAERDLASPWSGEIMALLSPTASLMISSSEFTFF